MNQNCKRYSELTPNEQSLYVGRLLIAIQYNDSAFRIGEKIIKAAEDVGIYEKVDVDLNPSFSALSDLQNRIENFTN